MQEFSKNIRVGFIRAVPFFGRLLTVNFGMFLFKHHQHPRDPFVSSERTDSE